MPFRNGVYYDETTDPEEPVEPTPPDETDPDNPDPPVDPDDPWGDLPEEPDTPVEPIPKPMTKSILLTIKKMLGIAEEYHAFDLDVIIDINATFLTLNQLGIGPIAPFSITGEDEVWTDFLDTQNVILQGIQTYVYLRVRLMFDPPANSFIVNSFEKQIQELEWRLCVQAEYFDRNPLPEEPIEPEPPDGPDEPSEPTDPDNPEEPDTPTDPTEPETPEQALRRQRKKQKTLFDIFR